MIHVQALRSVPYSSIVVVLCMVAATPVAFIGIGFGALYPFIQEDLGVNRAQLGLISSVIFVGGTATVLLAGWLVDRVGAHKLETLSLFGVVVGLLLFSQIQTLTQGILVGFFIGVVMAATYPSYTKAIMDWLKPGTRGLAMGFIEGGITAGGILAALLLTYLGLNFSWRAAVIVVAIMIGVAALTFFAFYRDKPESREDRKSRQTSGHLSLVVKNRDMLVITLFGAAFVANFKVFTSYLVLFLKEDLNMSAGLAGGLLAVAMAGGAAGRFGLGLVSDLLMDGRRVIIITLLGMSCIAFMAAMAWLPSSTPRWMVIVLIFFVGVATMGWGALYTIFVAELATPALTGTAIGFTNTVQRIFTFGVTPVFGFLVDRTGSYDVGWWMMAGLAALGTGTLAFMRPETRRR